MTYEPALCLPLRLATTDLKLHVILAACGTVLDVMDETPATLPIWVTQLTQLPTVDVIPSVYRQWKRDYTAIRTS